MQTSETPLAAFLIQSGFTLKEIWYAPRPSGRPQGFFVFADSRELDDKVNQYATGPASINLVLYERTKAGLIDRVMRGEP